MQVKQGLSGLKRAIHTIEKTVIDTEEILNPPLDLICGVCLGVMYKPCTLPCKHNFCTNCLKTILLKEQYIICPFCRRHCPQMKRIDVNRKLAEEIQGELRQPGPTEKYSAKEYVIEISTQHFKESLLGLEIKHFWEINIKLANKRKHRSHQMIDQIVFKFTEGQDIVKKWGAAHSIQLTKYGTPGVACTVAISFAPSLHKQPLELSLELSDSEELIVMKTSVILGCKHSELKPSKIDSSKSVKITNE